MPSSPPRDAPSLASPPDVLDLLAACLKGRTRPRLSDLIPNASKNSSVLESKLRMLCPLTSKLFDVFASFSHAPSEKEAQTDGACAGDSARIARVRSVVETMDKVGLGLSQLARLPFGVALPLREALRSCQLDPPASWSARAYRLVDRADLAKQISPKANPRWLRDGVMVRTAAFSIFYYVPLIDTPVLSCRTVAIIHIRSRHCPRPEVSIQFPLCSSARISGFAM